MLEHCISWGIQVRDKFKRDINKEKTVKIKERYKCIKLTSHQGIYIGTVAIVDETLTLMRPCEEEGIIFTNIQGHTDRQLGILLKSLVDMTQEGFNEMLVDCILHSDKNKSNKYLARNLKNT